MSVYIGCPFGGTRIMYPTSIMLSSSLPRRFAWGVLCIQHASCRHFSLRGSRLCTACRATTTARVGWRKFVQQTLPYTLNRSRLEAPEHKLGPLIPEPSRVCEPPSPPPPLASKGRPFIFCRACRTSRWVSWVCRWEIPKPHISLIPSPPKRPAVPFRV